MDLWRSIFLMVEAIPPPRLADLEDDDDDEVEEWWDEDELVPVVALSRSPRCPQCGAPLDEHDNRGECPPF